MRLHFYVTFDSVSLLFKILECFAQVGGWRRRGREKPFKTVFLLLNVYNTACTSSEAVSFITKRTNLNYFSITLPTVFTVIKGTAAYAGGGGGGWGAAVPFVKKKFRSETSKREKKAPPK